MESPASSTNRVVDLRSDTVTQPTREMRVAMMEAEVGDDVMGEDPTVCLLQEKVAEILEKDSALFVPTGTMANLVSVMVHCGRRGDEVLVGDRCHITTFEQGGVASIGGVHARTVKTFEDGKIDLEEVRAKIFPEGDDHYPHSTLLCVENSHSLTGGRVLPLDYMAQVGQLVREKGLKLHVDGARLFNAAEALGVPPAQLVQHAHSVSVCLSKGLGAPVGSVLAGSKSFIAQARRVRKSLGGGMRQVGVLAAAGLVALETMRLRLHVDHENARILAEGLAEVPGLRVDSVETNFLIIHTELPGLTSEKLLELMAAPSPCGVVVKMFTITPSAVRAVLHHNVDRDDVNSALIKFTEVMDSMRQVT